MTRVRSHALSAGKRVLAGAASAIVLVLAASHLTGTARAATPRRACVYIRMSADAAIDCMWPARSRATARRIAECESTASAPDTLARLRGLGRWAVNGQYVGIFQMGERERRAHGWYRRGAPAPVEVAAALSLYHDRGWSPWSCA